ncbi:MAG: hypothetical protein KBD10_01355 [Candidatus Pacebacteria bacterium]|nr:hypothetical protein [Candidatus Paceibacterota bacterium]
MLSLNRFVRRLLGSSCRLRLTTEVVLLDNRFRQDGQSPEEMIGQERLFLRDLLLLILKLEKVLNREGMGVVVINNGHNTMVIMEVVVAITNNPTTTGIIILEEVITTEMVITKVKTQG